MPLVALDERAERAAAGLIDRMEAAALAGDVGAARLLLDRAWPARRGRPLAAALKLPADPNDALNVILGAVGDGRLTIEEAEGLARIIAAKTVHQDLALLREELAQLRAEQGNDD